VGVLALTAGAAAVGIERVTIKSGLHYVATAVWMGDDLIALDLPTNSFRRIGRDGEVTEVYRVEEVMMMAIGPLPGKTDEFLVKFNRPEEWQSVKLGEGKSWSFKPSWTCEDCATSGVSWAALHRDRILAVGDVKEGGEWGEEGTRTTSGIFWIGPDGPELSLELPDAALPLYFGTQPYVAVARGKGYAIVPENLEEGTGWLKVIELEPYNRSVRTVTRLPARMPPMRWTAKDDVVEAMRAVSDQRIPVALLGWQDRLFVVDREYEGYLVWEIEPTTGQMRFLDSIEGGDFVTIVPGRNSWAVIEKGPVVEFGRQAFRGLGLYPAERFSGLVGG
jgi:hypothetical protein